MRGSRPQMLCFHPALLGSHSAAWPETVWIARDAGFGALEVDLRAIDDLQGSSDAVELLGRAAMVAAPSPMPVEFRETEERFVEDLRRLDSLAALAAQLGIGTLYRSVPSSCDEPAGVARQTIKRRLQSCLEILRNRGLTFAVEAVSPLHRRTERRNPLIWTLDGALSLAEELGHDVGVVLDVWHWHHANESVEVIERAKGRAKHVHIADAPAIPAEEIRDDRRLLPGQGVVDLQAFRAALQAIEYDGFVSLEVSGYDCAAVDPVDCARRAREAAELCLPG